MLKDTRSGKGYQLNVANALWCQSGVPFRDEFLTLNETHYQAKPNGVDFVKATEQARQTINAWVEKQTQDKIKELLKPGILKPTTRLVLTNAIYFKGDWALQVRQEADPRRAVPPGGGQQGQRADDAPDGRVHPVWIGAGRIAIPTPASSARKFSGMIPPIAHKLNPSNGSRSNQPQMSSLIPAQPPNIFGPTPRACCEN